MRKIFLTLVAAMTIALAPASLGAQTDNETQVKTEQTTTAKTVKPGEPTNLIYRTKDGKTLPVYRGKKGGLFVIRTSQKTGNEYRQYVKEEQCERA